MLKTNQFLTSISNNFFVVMQIDGNLVVYRDLQNPNYAIWATNTDRQFASYHLSMQYDGNLVIYDQNGTPIWASNTWSANNPNYHL